MRAGDRQSPCRPPGGGSFAAAHTLYKVASRPHFWAILGDSLSTTKFGPERLHPGLRGARRWSKVIVLLQPEHTVSPQPERIEGRSAEDRKQDRTIIIVSRPSGFFGKAVALVTALFLFALAFVFSLLFFAILAAVILVILAYVWWASRHARSSVRIARHK